MPDERRPVRGNCTGEQARGPNWSAADAEEGCPILLHLLHGSFDVDPQAIGHESVLRNGLTYSYFGVVLALLRLPFLFLRDFATTDLSCLVAVSLMGAANLASLLTVWRAVRRPEQWPLLVIIALTLMFGGAQIQFLSAAIWQEAFF